MLLYHVAWMHHPIFHKAYLEHLYECNPQVQIDQVAKCECHGHKQANWQDTGDVKMPCDGLFGFNPLEYLRAEWNVHMAMWDSQGIPWQPTPLHHHTLQHVNDAQPLKTMPRPAKNMGYSNLSADMIHLLRKIRPLDTVIHDNATMHVTSIRPVRDVMIVRTTSIVLRVRSVLLIVLLQADGL